MPTDNRVEYGMGKNVLAVVGVAGGVGIAIGLPAVTLKFGPGLPAWLHAMVIILSLLVGGAVAFIAAFFGMVLPKSAGSTATVSATIESGGESRGSAGDTQRTSTHPQAPSK